MAPGAITSTTIPRSAPASPAPAQAGSYRLTTVSGAEISFTLPTPASHPALEAIEAYRGKIGADPVSYVVAQVDNRKGTAPVDMYMVSASDDQGREVSFSRVTDVIQSWGPTYSYDFKWTMGDGTPIDEAVGAELRREATGLQSANADVAEAGEQTHIVLASAEAELPAKVTRVTVQPSGMGVDEEARPAS
ncbi:hypothetical protein [Pseudarthrobacter sp. NamE5]|uniref:hypothetical protein n=1 Tax=Pseudarthrobacter sp. NamE5 TaxID=2576839 RepID=UPI00110AABCD|nr:hypothetical protein [Pseudarthrobacter sp. NamE5]TLM85811.1 hypothetical protein FDW84_08365 [Pseudarthrobacter sp. NamE5]